MLVNVCVKLYNKQTSVYVHAKKQNKFKSTENKNNDYMYNLSTMSYFDTQTHEMHNS